MTKPKDVTQLLINWRNGDQSAIEKLVPIVYDELHRIAQRYLRRQRPNHTLQTTALVHEAYIRLLEKQETPWQNRAHFLGIAAQMMRQILVNYAEAQDAEKRGGGCSKVSLDEALVLPGKQDLDILSLNEALENLAAMDERKSKIVELRFFAGLSNEEVAEVMGISLATVNREWRMARALLLCELKKDEEKG